MRLYQSKQWNTDLIETVNAYPELNRLSGKRIMITGACGLICSAIIDLLVFFNESHQEPVQIYAAARSEQRIIDRFGDYVSREYFHFVQYDAETDDFALPLQLDYIIHGAGNATPERIMRYPVETMTANFQGVYHLLKKAGDSKVKRLLYISSSEVYGRKETASGFCESEYGFIDLLKERNSYSVGKRAAETLCVSFAKEYGIETVIVRPGHIYGPTATERDNRVSSAWAYAAAKGETITMKSAGQQVRSYCHCLDCATAILYVLLFGESQTAYNIANRDSKVSIRDMALLYAKAANTEVVREDATEAEKRAFNPMDNSTLNSERLYALGWTGRFRPEEGFRETIRVLQEIL